MGEFVLPSLAILVGLALLAGGCELLVRGAAALALAVRISPLVVGLTIVALGTSAPEFAVTLQSSYRGQTDLAVGNVVGSNIANVLLILGAAATVAPLAVASRLLRLDVPLMIVASFALLALGLDGNIGRLDGLLLVAGLVTYVVWTVRQSRYEESRKLLKEYKGSLPSIPSADARAIVAQCLLIAIGLLLLILGARWMVDGAVQIARIWGTSDLLIGLTIVALGTSLPELATSIVASLRGQRDIAVGNAVGSNLFNLLGVLGLAALVAPRPIPVPYDAIRFDIPVMIATAVACLPIFFINHRISRWEGALFLVFYLLYLGHIAMMATGAPGVRTFRAIMLIFVIPLTTITLLVGVARTMKRSDQQ